MLVIGIDEAGYGPLLGPLVVAGAAFRVALSGSESGADLQLDDARGSDGEPVGDDGLAGASAAQESLRRALARRSAPAVGDSKRLYERGGVAALERGVLAFLGARGDPPRTRFDDLLAAVGVSPDDRRSRRWYAAEPARFPLHMQAADVAAGADGLSRALARDGHSAVGLAARVVLEDQLNRRFAERGNKATVLFELSADVLAALVDLAHPGEPVLAVFDRQGGRKNYLPPLQHRFADDFVWRVSESRDESVYRLRVAGRPLLARFVVKGDARAPQVGLASMLAKYLREVHMALWNDWFAQIFPGVRATAGYVTDGRRWLAETRAARLAAGIPDEDLTRTR